MYHSFKIICKGLPFRIVTSKFNYSSFGSFTAGLCPTVLESTLEDESSSLTSSSLLTVDSVIGCVCVVVRSVRFITKSLINVSVS